MTRQLVDEVRPRQRYLRSANVEQHATFGVDDYIPTGRALEVLHRVARALHGDTAGRAWSLTGPYGSGKSSFALFLHALLGPGDARHATARAALYAVDPDLASQLDTSRHDLHAASDGFLRAAATAQAEPAARTVLRALNSAVGARWRTRPPAAVAAAQMRALAEPTARSLGQLLDALAEHAPVVIMLDEFGKNLEHFAVDPDAGDLFVLQELAERCSAGRTRHPALLVTLQHLAFDDYVRGASATQRREWGKVQGRFEDISFLDSADQTLRLIPAAFDDHDASPSFRRRRAAWAAEQRQACTDLGLQRLLPDAADLLERCYPLHPLVLLALPELCGRFGQHGRTLFAFLTGHEPGSVGEFLQQPLPGRGPLPSVDLDRLYDFFAGPGLSGTSSHASRWLEIETVLREATGLSEAERRVLKTVGVLNLLSQGGPLRAHPGLLDYSATSSLGRGVAATAGSLLAGLAERGLLTYRGFADEYRLWQGSDLDLARIVSDELDALTGQPTSVLLASRHQMPPAIASRHTQQVGMIRYFDTAFADSAQTRVPAAEAGADGLLVYWLGAADAASDVEIDPVDLERRLPVVVATTTGHAAITEAALELVAVEKAIERPDVSSDRVARRELQERAAQARRRLDDLLAQHLRPNAPDSSYQRVNADPGRHGSNRGLNLTPLPASRSLSGLLSDVCDDAYCHSPEIRNEMLGRRQLTSQAARARRDLLEAMVTHPDLHRHGLEGYGPEVAMYEALLAHTGLHQPVDPQHPEGPWHFTNPHHSTTFSMAWGKLKMLLGQASEAPISLDRAYTELQAPPIGLKEGPIPLLLAALLLQHTDTAAIYQDDSYQPQLGADLLERLLKSPDRFTVKTFDADGTRSEVLRRLRRLTLPSAAPAAAGGPGRRNSTVLQVAAPLITAVASLPAYSRKTSNLAEETRQVRDVLLSARQPDELLFNDLPQACGIAPFLPGEANRARDAAAYGDRLQAAMTDLDNAYARLLGDSAALVAANFATELAGLHEVPVLRGRLRNAAGPLAEAPLLDRKLRAFVLAVLDNRDSDQGWLESLLSLVVGMPAVSWQDQDLTRYRVQLPDLAEQLRRLVALHTAAAAEGRDGFDALRVNVTRPDGHEQHRVVWLDHRSAPELEAILDAALASARAVLDVQGDAALLALLAGRVLSAPPGTLTQAPTTPPMLTTTTSTAKEQAHG